MKFYCDAMINATDGNNRVIAGSNFNKLFAEALSKPNSFNENFSDLKWISIKNDANNSFRIFTWQIQNENEIFQSYGYIQTKDGKVYPLNDKITTVNKDYEYEEMSPDNWFGSLYYNIKEISTKEGPAFLLFGYDGFDSKTRIKVIDVLRFVNGVPVFGSEIFKMNNESRPDIKQRFVLDYSAVANATCNFNEELGIIMFDFLEMRTGITQDGGPAKIPDGTYCGFKQEGNLFTFIEKLDTQVLSPDDVMMKPKKQSTVKKDILGRTKN